MGCGIVGLQGRTQTPDDKGDKVPCFVLEELEYVEESCCGEGHYEDYGSDVGRVVAVWDPGGWVVEGWVVG
jgi:hypothetical protein